MIVTQSLLRCDFSKVLRTASRLDRLSKFYETESDRAKIPELLSLLGEIIDTTEEVGVQPFKAILIKGGISVADEEEEDVGGYLSLLPSGLDTVKKYATAVFKDLSRIQPNYPIFRRSDRGLGGVTFVEFDDINFVVKWAKPIEKGASKIYALFLEILADPLLHVPESTEILDVVALPLHLHPEFKSAIRKWKQSQSLLWIRSSSYIHRLFRLEMRIMNDLLWMYVRLEHFLWRGAIWYWRL